MKATIPTEQAQGADQRADAGRGRRLAARGAIVLSFVVALEIVIMISPFALFFYAVFNPVLLTLDRSPRGKADRFLLSSPCRSDL